MDVPVARSRRRRRAQGQGGRQGVRGLHDPAARGRARPAPRPAPQPATRRRQRCCDVHPGAAAAPRQHARSRAARRCRYAARAGARQYAVAEAACVHAACQPVGAQIRARARRRSGRMRGHRPEGTHHPGRRAGFRQGRADPGAGSGAGVPRRRAAPFNLPEWPQVDFAKFGPIEAKPLSRIQRISGARTCMRSWVISAARHPVSTRPISPISRPSARQLKRRQRKEGVKLTHARLHDQGLRHGAADSSRVQCLARRGGENLVLKKYFHIGFAADTPDGLVVPVIRDADRKGVFEIARETGRAVQAGARQKLSRAEMQGGTLHHFEPGRHRRHGVHAHHQCARSRHPRRVADRDAPSRSAQDGGFSSPRLMLPLSLSYDHRVIDGAAGRALHVLSRVGAVRHPPLLL